MRKKINSKVAAEHVGLIGKHILDVSDEGTLLGRKLGQIGVSRLYEHAKYRAWDQDVSYEWGPFGDRDYAYRIDGPESKREMTPDDWVSVQGIITAIRLNKEIE